MNGLETVFLGNLMKKISFFLSSLLLVSVIMGAPSIIEAASADQSIQAATDAYKKGNFTDAARLFAIAAEELTKAKNPQAALLWGNAALALFKAGDFQGSADLYDSLLSQNNKLPKDKLEQFYTNLVLSRSKLEQPALVINAIERMLKALPKINPLLLANLYAAQGDAYRALELYVPAAAAYDKAINILPKDAPAEQFAKMLATLGQSQRNMGQYQKAISNYEKASKLAKQINHPQLMAETQSNLGIINTDIGNYPAAKDRINEALNISKNSKLRLQEGSDITNMGQVHIYTGQYANAKNLFDEGIAIAREVGNTKGEAVATVNRALVNRLLGEVNDARNDYKTAIGLFEKCGLKEGMATANLGMGRLAQFTDRNYEQALQNYQKALEIFTDLNHPRGQASAILMIAELYKNNNAPKRTTRDLVFDDEPINLSVSNTEADTKALDYYAQALKIAEEIGAKEIIWGAHQGLGYGEYKKGNLEAALDHYQKAIDLVTGMFLSREDAQLMGQYMADKEALYNEAQEVCAALFDKTKDKKYLDLQLKYADTLNNEIQKASAAMATLNFENAAKQKSFERLKYLANSKAQLEKTKPVVNKPAQNASAEAKENNRITKAALAIQDKEIEKLDKEYSALLAAWKKDYPNDASIFESNSRINIADIQKTLKNEHAVLQYVTLPDKLIINCIKKNSVESVAVPVTKAELENTIRQKFVLDYLHYGFSEGKVDENPKKYLKDVSTTLSSLYDILIKPIRNDLQGINRLYILNNGVLSTLPYSALVTSYSDETGPEFLVEKFEISNIRPAFANVLEKKAATGSMKKMLAVANPVNANFYMKLLPGALTEVKNANDVLHEKQSDKNIALEPLADKARHLTAIQAASTDFPELPSPPDRPTETWLKDKLMHNNYEMLYFATHGQAQSDTYSKIKTGVDERKKAGKKLGDRASRWNAMLEGNLSEKTPLNGFLYLSNEQGDDILKGSVPEERDGLFTIKEIIGMDDKHFANTRFVALSACNAAVSMVPAAIAEGYDEGEKNAELFDPKLLQKEMSDLGMIPGVDQVSFVESFMKKGVQDVYASYWPVEDKSASIILPVFMQTLVEQRENPDPVTALNVAQKNYIQRARKKEFEDKLDIAIHPYYWAVGAMFGK